MAFSALKRNIYFLAEFSDVLIFEQPYCRKKLWFSVFKRINAAIFILQTFVAIYTNRHNFALFIINSIFFVGFCMASAIHFLLLHHQKSVCDLLTWCESHHNQKKSSTSKKLAWVDDEEELTRRNFCKAAQVNKLLSEFFGTYLTWLLPTLSILVNIVTSIIYGEYRTILIIHWPCHQKLNVWTFVFYTLQHSLTITYIAAQMILFNTMFWTFLIHLDSHYKVIRGLIKRFGKLASINPNDLDEDLYKSIIDKSVEAAR